VRLTEVVKVLVQAIVYVLGSSEPCTTKSLDKVLSLLLSSIFVLFVGRSIRAIFSLQGNLVWFSVLCTV
jgi:hypothetical protein